MYKKRADEVTWTIFVIPYIYNLIPLTGSLGGVYLLAKKMHGKRSTLG